MARQVRIILQARTSSTRLPGKVLLPIGGMPLALLCARRLGASGLQVTLATSQERSDDVLAQIAESAGTRVFRGSLANVLDRFVQCAADLNDDDLVVRATADNPLPNGEFIDYLLQRFSARSTDYVATLWPADGLPYGLCAEVMTVAALRRAAQRTHEPFDREHVTPWLARRRAPAGDPLTGRLLENDYSHLRATIDTLEDYLALAALFAGLDQPVEIDWRELIPKLPEPSGTSKLIPALRRNREFFRRITLGTAQLGQTYGIANRAGKPDDAEAAAILSLAVEAGLGYLDTARAYGDAESRIGRLLPPRDRAAVKIVTKVNLADSVPDEAPVREIRSAVDASVYGSCRDLVREQLDVVMFHHAPDMFRWHGAAIDRLQELMDREVILALGVSVYAPGEAMQALQDSRISHLQIPFNLVDSRWLNGGFLEALAKRPEVRVHARSVFLQGLLTSSAGTWPTWFTESQLFVQHVSDLARQFGRRCPADLCMAYARSFPWVSTLVLGVDTRHQLLELLGFAAEPTLTEEQISSIQACFAGAPPRLLNPSLW